MKRLVYWLRYRKLLRSIGNMEIYDGGHKEIVRVRPRIYQ